MLHRKYCVTSTSKLNQKECIYGLAPASSYSADHNLVCQESLEEDWFFLTRIIQWFQVNDIINISKERLNRRLIGLLDIRSHNACGLFYRFSVILHTAVRITNISWNNPTIIVYFFDHFWYRNMEHVVPYEWPKIMA